MNKAFIPKRLFPPSEGIVVSLIIYFISYNLMHNDKNYGVEWVKPEQLA